MDLYNPGNYVYWDCPDEWIHIVEEALTLLRAFKEKLHVIQIKQKFGGLRIYIGYHNTPTDEEISQVNAIIKLAEWAVEGYEAISNRGLT